MSIVSQRRRIFELRVPYRTVRAIPRFPSESDPRDGRTAPVARKSPVNASRSRKLEQLADSRASESVEQFRELARQQLEANPAQEATDCPHCEFNFPRTDQFFQRYVRKGVEYLDTAHCLECRKLNRRTKRRRRMHAESGTALQLLEHEQKEARRRRSDQRLDRAIAAALFTMATRTPQESDEFRRCLTCPNTFLLSKKYFSKTPYGFSYSCKFCRLRQKRERRRMREDGATPPDTKLKRRASQSRVRRFRLSVRRADFLSSAEEVLRQNPEIAQHTCPCCSHTFPLEHEGRKWFKLNKSGRRDRRDCLLCIADATPHGPLGQFVRRKNRRS